MAEERALPRPFTMHWGSGQITEEASFTGAYKEACIQLLEYAEGEAAGGWSIRFCYYSRDGRFQRGPLIIDEADLDGLRQVLTAAPRLRALLRRLLMDADTV
jgi:hypothetical protein